MTQKQQVKKDVPKAVELNEAALDRAAGGVNVYTGQNDGDLLSAFYGTGVYKSVVGGKT